MASRKRRHAVRGVLPWMAGGLVGAIRWVIQHPQPVLLMLALGAAGFTTVRHVRHSEAFRVAYVYVPPESSLKLSRTIVGQNIWQVDVQALSAELRRQQPWLKDVRVVRRLPDTIHLQPIARTPVAQVRLDRWYAVDAEGVIIPNGAPEALDRLPRLLGVGQAGSALKVGVPNDEAKLRLALRILETARRSSALSSQRLEELDVSDPRQIRFVLQDATEIRCGSEAELPAHLERLRVALDVVKKERLDARYIDVRFQEPVVAPRALSSGTGVSG